MAEWCGSSRETVKALGILRSFTACAKDFRVRGAIRLLFIAVCFASQLNFYSWWGEGC